MASKSIPHVSVVVVNFDQVAASADEEIVRQFIVTCRLSRKRLFPKNSAFDAFQVTRMQNEIRIALLSGDRIAGYFSFLPSPDFSQRMLST